MKWSSTRSNASTKLTKNFFRFALDSNLIEYRWERFDFSSEKLQNLAKGLAPAYLRLGGTEEDFLLFIKDHTFPWNFTREQSIESTISRGQHMDPYTNFTMTTKDVDNIFTFARESSLNII